MALAAPCVRLSHARAPAHPARAARTRRSLLSRDQGRVQAGAARTPTATDPNAHGPIRLLGGSDAPSLAGGAKTRPPTTPTKGQAMRGSTRKRGKTWTAYWDATDPETGRRRQRSKGSFATQKAA